MRLPAAAFLAVIAMTTSAFANDSLAVLGAGGLELTTSPDIVMESEELYLSPRQIRVRYVFRNDSDKNITTRVAFPLPYVPFGPAENVALPRDHDDNFVGFSVMSNGQSIEPVLEQRAIDPAKNENNPKVERQAGIDITAKVLEAGLPINANLPSWKEKLHAMPRDVLKRLVQQEILYDGGGGDDDIEAQWVLRATYHWEQIFPAHQKVVLEHSYQPVVGGSYLDVTSGKLNGLSKYRQDYCLDSTGTAGLQHLAGKAVKARPNDALVMADEVSYILTTGANWKGPIGDFALTIDKVDPDAVLSLCIDGIKKTGPTTFKVQRSNFTPKEDIRFVVFGSRDKG